MNRSTSHKHGYVTWGKAGGPGMALRGLQERGSFKRGQRVRATPDAVAVGVLPRGATGVVRGFGRSHFHICVQRTGQKSTTTYHMKFWEPAAAEEGS